MTTRHATRAVTLAACALTCLAHFPGCEESSSSTSSAEPLDNLSDDPQSLLGRSAKQAKDLRDEIEQRDAAAAGLAEQIAGADAVEVAGLRWTIPEGWQAVEPANSMRAAELRVPNPLGESLVTFSTAGGDVQQNVTRWGAQVLDPVTGEPQRPRARRLEIAGRVVHTVELSGTYLDGPPGGAPTERPYHMLRGAIVDGPSGLVFVKMTGPEDAMTAAAGAWNAMIGGMTAP